MLSLFTESPDTHTSVRGCPPAQYAIASGLVGSAVGFHSVWEYSTGPPARDERLFSIAEPYPQSEGMQT